MNQSACLLVMSWAEAERRGVPPEKIIFLTGSGEVKSCLLEYRKRMLYYLRI